MTGSKKGYIQYQNSLFENLGSPSLDNGAGISISHANIHLINVTFKNNQAINGGALNLF